MSKTSASIGKPLEVFWGEVSPCEHIVQLYQDDSVFIDALESFVVGGMRAGEATIVIATAEHRGMLETRLQDSGVDVGNAIWNGTYFPLDAAKMLSEFMIDGWPDDERFAASIRHVIDQARRDGQKVRAFGEMVALLWAQGHHGATVRLEHLWNDLLQDTAIAVFCAYPQAGFTQDARQSIAELCAAHTRVIAA